MNKVAKEPESSVKVSLKYRKFTIKVGSNVLMHEGGRHVHRVISALAQDIQLLMNSGAEVLLVSSGAIALGRQLVADEKNAKLPLLSVVGQSALTSIYDQTFRGLGIQAAQLLVTNGDVGTVRCRNMLCDTIRDCMRNSLLPILNENDASSAWSGASQPCFDDNDSLAALLAAALGTECLVLLTDVDGVFTVPPSCPEARLVCNLVNAPDAQVTQESSDLGRGGMSSKVRAAQYAVKQGCRRAVIANGCRPSVLEEIAKGLAVGSILDREQINA
ncbi:MAG: hypothetical protein CXZ00_11065 [Acidobacteria bacterium]|nr:MAG: hypothetical protein CXZ00_11065 [Acidobacteriota bacterium]